MDPACCLRIFCILGFTWFFGLVTIFIPPDEPGSFCYTLETILVYLHVIFNGLQGVFIFSVFTTNQRVFGLYKGLWGAAKKKVLKKPLTHADDIVANDTNVCIQFS